MALTRRTLLESMYEGLSRIEQKLDAAIPSIQAGIAMANAAVTALIQQFNDETNAIQARIDRLLELVQTGTVTPEQIAELQSISTRLGALGQDPENPIP